MVAVCSRFGVFDTCYDHFHFGKSELKLSKEGQCSAAGHGTGLWKVLTKRLQVELREWSCQVCLPSKGAFFFLHYLHWQAVHDWLRAQVSHDKSADLIGILTRYDADSNGAAG